MQRVTRMEAPLFQLDSYSNPSSGRKLGEEFGMHFGMHIWLIWPPHWPAGSSEVDLTVLVPFHHRIATTISQQSPKFTSPASHICHIWHVLSFCLAIPMLTSLALMIQISAGHWEWNKGLAALEVGGLLPQHSAWHDLIQNDLTTEWMDAILPCPQVSHGAQSLSGAFKCWLKKHRASFFCMPGIPEPHPSAFLFSSPFSPSSFSFSSSFFHHLKKGRVSKCQSVKCRVAEERAIWIAMCWLLRCPSKAVGHQDVCFSFCRVLQSSVWHGCRCRSLWSHYHFACVPATPRYAWSIRLLSSPQILKESRNLHVIQLGSGSNMQQHKQLFLVPS